MRGKEVTSDTCVFSLRDWVRGGTSYWSEKPGGG